MTNDKCKVIGLTGSIGSGKTEAATSLRRRGAYIIEADKIGHELIKSKSERRVIAEVVFSDPKELKRLNKIAHPYIKKRIREEINNCKLSVVSCKLIVIDAALPHLFKGLVDEVWVVMASKENRTKRLLKKGLSRDGINKRMESQMADKEYRKIADVIINNNGDVNSLRKKILSLIVETCE